MSDNSNSIFRAVLTGSAWSFVGVLLAVAFFYWQEYRNPFVFKIEVLDEFNLVEVREQIKDLKILYKNEDIIESNQEIKVIRIQVRNEGDTILQGYYDQLEPFGLRFVESKVLTSEVVNTSSDDLKSRLIKGIRSESDKKYSDVIFSKVIFDEGDFVTLKVTILLDESRELKIIPLGKIANVDKLKIDVIEPDAAEERPITLYIVGGYFGFLVFLISVIAIITFFEDKVKKKKIEKFVRKYGELSETENKITNIYKEMSNPQERLIKALLGNDHALDLRQVMEAQIPDRSTIKKVFLFPSIVSRKNRYRFLDLPKEIFDTDGSTVSFNRENEEFIRMFFKAVL